MSYYLAYSLKAHIPHSEYELYIHLHAAVPLYYFILAFKIVWIAFSVSSGLLQRLGQSETVQPSTVLEAKLFSYFSINAINCNGSSIHIVCCGWSWTSSWS